MIIILNGMYGTNIQNIAKQLSLILNNNETNEISNIYENLSFNESFQVNHKEDDTNPFHTIDKEIKDNTQVEEKIKSYYSTIEKYSQIEDLNKKFINSYDFDFGFKDKQFVTKYTDLDNEFFENIKSKYDEVKKDLKHYIICGQIGNYGIKQLKKYFEDEDIKIFNIIMNPSISELNTKVKINEKDLFCDVHNAITLKNDREVETIKFENILLSGGFLFNNKFIKLFNINIDKFEENDINILNTKYSNVDFLPLWAKNYCVDLNEDEIQELKNEYFESYNTEIPNLVKNCFRELRYKIQK